MVNYKKILIVIFLAITLIKIIFASQIPTISMITDEYIYAQMAKSVITEGNLLVDGQHFDYPFLYPIIISVAYFSDKPAISYLIIKIINAILSSLIIIPAWLLAREFLNEKKAFFAAVLIICLPSTFAFAGFILAENLFYPLFLLGIYLIFKSISSNKPFFAVSCGICLVMLTLAKNTGIILLPAPIIGYIAKKIIFREHLRRNEGLRNLLFVYLTAAIIFWIFLPVITSSHYMSEFITSSTSDVTAVIRHDNYFSSFLSWYVIYAGFLLLSSGLIFGVLSFFAFKDKRRQTRLIAILSLVAIAFTLFVGANHAAGGSVMYGTFSWFTERPITRYVDMVTPLLIILGIIGFETYAKNRLFVSLKYLLFASSAILLWASQITFAPLFPVNNLQLTHIGLLKFLIEKTIPVFPEWLLFAFFAILFWSLPFVFIILNSKKRLKLVTIVFVLLIYFLSVGFLSYSVSYYNAKTGWDTLETATLGRWINENLQKDILLVIDKNTCVTSFTGENRTALCIVNAPYSSIGFFVKNQIKIAEITDKTQGYIVTTRYNPLLRLVKQISKYYIYTQE